MYATPSHHHPMAPTILAVMILYNKVQEEDKRPRERPPARDSIPLNGSERRGVQ